ncbi:MAG: hypothetical protein AB7G93_00920 [Bdellovibrionales bacterium]
MSLKTTPVSQCLDKKLKFLGYEIPDLLLILGFLSVMNFLFGSLAWKIVIVWAPTLLLAVVLRIGKHGKPDNYLLHKIRFLGQPKVLRAFPDSHSFSKLPEFIRGV